MKQKIKNLALLFVLCLGCLVLKPVKAQEYNADMGVSSNGIWFSPSEFFAGQSVRIYARIENLGQEDITGKVAFYQGVEQIGRPQTISIVAGGQAEEIWTDEWVPPEGRVNVKVSIIDADPMDENWNNNEAISRTFELARDTDGDLIGDDEDTDDDGDGMPDTWEASNGLNSLDMTDAIEDPDADGLNNLEEYQRGTNPYNDDTDGDGVMDDEDVFPNDPSETIDTDGDGIGNNADNDDDGDGVNDTQDKYPLDASRSSDPVPEPVETNTVESNDEIGNKNPFGEETDESSTKSSQEVAIEKTVEEIPAPELYKSDFDFGIENSDLNKKLDIDEEKSFEIKQILIFGFLGLIAGVLVILFVKELIRK